MPNYRSILRTLAPVWVPGLFVGVPWLLGVATRVRYPVHQQGVIVITGASSGIGRDAAVDLARNTRFTVLAGVRKDQDAKDIRAQALPNLIPIKLDVTSEEDITNVVGEVEKLINSSETHLVGLVNNAGTGHVDVLEFTSMETTRWLMEVNYFGAVRLTQRLLPMLREGQGRVLFTSSVAGFSSSPMMSAYSATKHALEAVVDSLRSELYPHKVSVSSIRPGFIATKLVEDTAATILKIESQPHYEIYKPVYGDIHTRVAKVSGLADSTEVSTKAILHALTSPYPHTRYHVANVGGLPVSLYVLIHRFMPDRLMDMILRMAV